MTLIRWCCHSKLAAYQNTLLSSVHTCLHVLIRGLQPQHIQSVVTGASSEIRSSSLMEAGSSGFSMQEPLVSRSRELGHQRWSLKNQCCRLLLRCWRLQLRIAGDSCFAKLELPVSGASGYHWLYSFYRFNFLSNCCESGQRIIKWLIILLAYFYCELILYFSWRVFLSYISVHTYSDNIWTCHRSTSASDSVWPYIGDDGNQTVSLS